MRPHHVPELLHMDAACGKTHPVAKDNFGAPGLAGGELGNGAALDQPAPVNTNEQAGFHPVR
jgi:hypothetical protein